MAPWLIGKALSPFVVLILATLVLVPTRKALQRRMAEGAFKRLLLNEHPLVFFLTLGLAFFVGVVYMRLQGVL